jgi:hypothetical protein
MGAHQPLDAMQAAGKSFRQHVMPDAPCAVGSIAALDGRIYLARRQRFRSSTMSRTYYRFFRFLSSLLSVFQIRCFVKQSPH